MPLKKLRPEFTFTEDRLRELQQVVPEAFADGKVNWDILRESLGEYLEDETQEHFGLTWPGKREARRLAAMPSKATLVPQPGEGVNEGNARNVFIEGENLEVLKLLQKSYAGRVKMIYIDPPYNTGNDFIYSDDYTEPLEAYLRRTGQKDESGELLTTNPRASGRFHSNWLNMMYPRLVLARQLLRRDGVIFVSIDDNEAGNLKSLMDEVFGEENHLVTLYIQVRYAGKTLAEKHDFQKLIEQVHVYRKTEEFRPIRALKAYTLDKFQWQIVEKSKGEQLELGGRRVWKFGPEQYEIRKTTASINGLKETWATGSILRGNASGKFFADHIASRKELDGLGVLYKVEGIGEDGLGFRYFTGPKREDATKGKFFSGVPLNRRFELEKGESTKAMPIVNYYNMADAFGNCRHEGETDFAGGKKPLAFMQILLNMATDPEEEEIVLDFFAGSASTGHAVIEKNISDNGNLKFILVQIPEPIQEANNETISKIGKERMRKVVRKLSSDLVDEHKLGFKCFSLERSNFLPWDQLLKSELPLFEGGFDRMVSPLIDSWELDKVFTETLLLLGFPLDSKIEALEDVSHNQIYRVAHEWDAHCLFVCLDEKVNPLTIANLKLGAEDVFVCLDTALTDESKLLLTDQINLHVI